MAKKNSDSGLMSVDDMPSTIMLSVKDLPAIKDWQVGEEYTLTLKVKQTGMHLSEGRGHGDFEVISAKGKVDTSGKNEKSPEEAKAESINSANMKKRRGY